MYALSLPSLPPSPQQFTLFVGIDVGKDAHVAGFVSAALLGHHRRFERCPTLRLENSRSGFQALVLVITAHYGVSLDQVAVLLESTGHYHLNLRDFLLEHEIAVYVSHARHRLGGLEKSDKRDSLSLASTAYNQLGLGSQILDKKQQIRPFSALTPTAAILQCLVRHRYELEHDATRRKNKLVAICDELFPEFTQLYKNPNLQTALAIRECFPTPASIAAASLEELRQARIGTRPGDAALVRLQELARTSIGTRNLARAAGLVNEQALLIRELRMLQGHLDGLDAQIAEVVHASREGQILRSLGIAPASAGVLIAVIGNIQNFQRADQLKSYFGWCPARRQSGITLDHDVLTKGGVRIAKRTMYLVIWSAIRLQPEWKTRYERLVPLKCTYDARRKDYRGKGKVIGRLAGDMTSLIFTLLRRDARLLAALPSGSVPPPPELYNAARRRLSVS